MRGEDKLLKQVDGVPLLARCAARAIATEFPVIVTVPPPGVLKDSRRSKVLARLGLTICEVPDASLGMAHSLRAGARAAQAANPDTALMILPADMPDIETGDLLTVIEAFTQAPPGTIVRACAQDGTPGHPVIFPPGNLAAFATLDGDHGARAILNHAAAQVQDVPLAKTRALTDLDTPEDWASWCPKKPYRPH